MKRLLSLILITSIYAQSEDKTEITVLLQKFEFEEILRNNEPHVLITDEACSIRSTLERILSLLPSENVSESLQDLAARIYSGYLTAPLTAAKEAIESAYHAIENYLSHLMSPEEQEQTRSHLVSYYQSIHNGGYLIKMPQA